MRETKTLEQALIPLDELKIISIMDDDGRIWVALRPIAEGLGLRWSGQYSKINRLKKEGVQISEHPVKTSGGIQKMIFIRLEDLPVYLYSINISKVKPEIKPKLLKFKKETAEAIRNYWMNKIKKEKEEIRQLQEEYNRLVEELRRIPTYEEYRELKFKYELLTSMVDMIISDVEKIKPNIEFLFTRIDKIKNGVTIQMIENGKPVKKTIKL